MKRFRHVGILVAVIALLCTAGAYFADESIPNLVGTWSMKAEGSMLLKGSAPGPRTHRPEGYSVLTAEITITKQEGRVLHGTFKGPKSTEKFIAVIGMDNKTFHYVDENGFMDARLVDKDTMEFIYRHTDAYDISAGVGTMTRKK